MAAFQNPRPHQSSYNKVVDFNECIIISIFLTCVTLSNQQLDRIQSSQASNNNFNLSPITILSNYFNWIKFQTEKKYHIKKY